MVKSALQEKKINLNKLERNPDGTPKSGILHKIDMAPPFTAQQAPSLYSKPRTPLESQMTGLEEHGGNYLLGGLSVIQREIDITDARSGETKKKWTKEAVVFRVVSEKHQMEDRWKYPEVKAFNGIPEAYEFAKKLWSETMLPALEESLRNQT
jgi:hypothetical protein